MMQSLVRGYLRRTSKKDLALVYHGITADRTRRSRWTLPLAAFRTHLDLIGDAGWTTRPLSALSQASDGDRPSIYLTFDDGFCNNVPAFEELAKRGMCATLFAVAGKLGELASWDASGGDARLLGAADLRTLDPAVVELGSHGLTHVDLTGLDDRTLAQELRDSGARLADAVGRAVDSFAYPFGAYDRRVLEATRGAGYRVACTTDSGALSARHDLHAVPRISVYGHDATEQFLAKLLFADNEVTLLQIVRYLAGRLRAGRH